jgi:hypothetical protein
MGTRANQRRLGFDRSDRIEQYGSASIIGEARIQIRKEPPNTLDGERRFVRQSGRRAFFRELLRPVEVGGREVAWITGGISMPPVLAITGRYRSERGVLEVSAAESVQRRRESRDRGGNDHTTAPADAARFGERLNTIGTLWQMIERSQEQDPIGPLVLKLECTGVANFGARERGIGARS